MSLRKRKKDKLREQILAVAESTFVKKGYAGTRMEDVAREVDISYRTLFNYFESKESLLLSVIANEQLMSLHYHSEGADPIYFDPRDALPTDLELRLERTLQRREILAMGAKYAGLFSTDHMQPPLVQSNRELRASRIKAVQRKGGIRNDISAMDIAYLYDVIRFTIVRHWLLTPDENYASMRTHLMSSLDIYLEGLKPPSTTSKPSRTAPKRSPTSKARGKKAAK